MEPVHGSIDIAVPADVLWQAFDQPWLWPRWNPCFFWYVNRRLKLGDHYRGIDQGAALEHQVLALELGIDERQQLRVGATLVQPLAKPAQRGVIRRFLHLEPDKAPERQPVAQRLFQAAIRQLASSRARNITIGGNGGRPSSLRHSFSSR